MCRGAVYRVSWEKFLQFGAKLLRIGADTILSGSSLRFQLLRHFYLPVPFIRRDEPPILPAPQTVVDFLILLPHKLRSISLLFLKFVNCKFLPGLSPQIFVSGAHPAKYQLRKVRKNTLFYALYIIF